MKWLMRDKLRCKNRQMEIIKDYGRYFNYFYNYIVKNNSEMLKITLFINKYYGRDIANNIINTSGQTSLFVNFILFAMNKDIQNKEYLNLIREGGEIINMNKIVFYDRMKHLEEIRDIYIENPYIDDVNNITIKNGFIRPELFKFIIIKNSTDGLNEIIKNNNLTSIITSENIIDICFEYCSYIDHYVYIEKNLKQMLLSNNFKNKKCLLQLIDLMTILNIMNHNSTEIKTMLYKIKNYQLTNVLNNFYLSIVHDLREDKRKFKIVDDTSDQSDIQIQKYMMKKYLITISAAHNYIIIDILYDELTKSIVYNLNNTKYFDILIHKLELKKIQNNNIEDLDEIINNIIEPNKKMIKIDDINDFEINGEYYL
jgi:hypothetical protein